MAHQFEFFAWVPMVSRGMGERLITQLVLRGMSVGPISQDDGPIPDQLVAICVQTNEEAASEVSAVIEDTLEQLGASYHAIIVTDPVKDMWWSTGKVRFPPDSKPKTSYEMLLDDDLDSSDEEDPYEAD